MRVRLTSLVVAAAMGGALGACATVSPSPSRAAVDLAPGGAHALRDARTVWIAGAVSRAGDVASGRAATGDSADRLREALRKGRRLELAASREQADLVLYFEQADRLRCWACRQPEGLWHWWGLVHDPTGRELASLHGETAAGADDAARRFAVELKKLLRHAGRSPREDATR
jgi:hypothetical protein